MSNGIEETAEKTIRKGYKALWDEDATVVKNLLRLGGWIVAIFQTGLLAWILYRSVEIVPAEWNTYFNAKGPQAWVNLALVAIVVLVIEWISKGPTINTITDISKDSSWQEKAVACVFMVGMAYVVAIAITART